MALLLRRNEFEGEDYSVIHRDAGGTEYDIGRSHHLPPHGRPAIWESADIPIRKPPPKQW